MSQYSAVVDIGANVGVYSVFFATFPSRDGDRMPVYSFEPSREAYRRLLENVIGNGVRNVSAFNAAVASERGVALFFEPEGHLTNGSFDRRFAGLFSNRVATNFVLRVNGEDLEALLEPYDSILLKLDAEGAEIDVLRGLEKVIQSKRPEIVLEVLAPYEEVLSRMEVLSHGYRFFQITRAGLEERSKLTSDNEFRDYLLVPNGPPV